MRSCSGSCSGTDIITSHKKTKHMVTEQRMSEKQPLQVKGANHDRFLHSCVIRPIRFDGGDIHDNISHTIYRERERWPIRPSSQDGQGSPQATWRLDAPDSKSSHRSPYIEVPSPPGRTQNTHAPIPDEAIACRSSASPNNRQQFTEIHGNHACSQAGPRST